MRELVEVCMKLSWLMFAAEAVLAQAFHDLPPVKEVGRAGIGGEYL